MTGIKFSKHTQLSPHDPLIGRILALQSSWVVPPKSAAAEKGFLLQTLSPGELWSLISGGGVIHVARLRQLVVGYLLISHIQELTNSLYEQSESSPAAKFTPARPTIEFDEYDYLHQIAVLKPFAGTGLGTTLLSHAQATTVRGLLASVPTEPDCNQAAIGFFEKNRFIAAGTWESGESPLSGGFRSRGMTWKAD